MASLDIHFFRPYQKDDIDKFFGRDEETDSLYKFVQQSKLTLLYGTSGTGKTSLVRCGLASRFRQAEWFELYLQRGNNINLSLLSRICAFTGIVPDEGLTIAEQIAEGITDIYEINLRPVYLIVDQLEELFIYGKEPEINDFHSVLQNIHNSSINCRIILIIRDEYYFFLNSLEKNIPLFKNKFRLEKISADKSKDVVRDIFAKESIVIEDDAVDYIIGDTHAGIDLPYLHAYLLQINNKILSDIDSNKRVSKVQVETNIGELSTVLSAYLEETVAAVAKTTNTSADNIWQMLGRFVSEENTKQAQKLENIAFSSPAGIDNKQQLELVVLELSKTYCLNRKDDGSWELPHDALALKIASKRSAEELADLKAAQLLKFKIEKSELLNRKDLKLINNYCQKYSNQPQIISLKTKRFISRSRRLSKTINALFVFFVFIVPILGITLYILNNNSKKTRIQLLRYQQVSNITKNVNVTLSYEIAKRGLKAGTDVEYSKYIKSFDTTSFSYITNSYKLEDGLRSVTLSKNGIIAYADNSVFYIDTNHYITSKVFSLKGKIIGNFTFRNKRCIAVRNGDTCEIRDANNYKFIKAVIDSAQSDDLDYNDLSKSLLVGDRLYKLDDKKTYITKYFAKLLSSSADEKGMMDCKFSADGKYIFRSFWGGYTRIYNLAGIAIKKIGTDNNSVTASMAISSDLKYLITGDRLHKVKIWLIGKLDSSVNYFNSKRQDTITVTQPYKILNGHTANVTSVSISADNKYILSGSDDKSAILWSISGKQLSNLDGHGYSVTKAEFSAYGKDMITFDSNGEILLWEKGTAGNIFKSKKLPDFSPWKFRALGFNYTAKDVYGSDSRLKKQFANVINYLEGLPSVNSYPEDHTYLSALTYCVNSIKVLVKNLRSSGHFEESISAVNRQLLLKAYAAFLYKEPVLLLKSQNRSFRSEQNRFGAYQDQLTSANLIDTADASEAVIIAANYNAISRLFIDSLWGTNNALAYAKKSRRLTELYHKKYLDNKMIKAALFYNYSNLSLAYLSQKKIDSASFFAQRSFIYKKDAGMEGNEISFSNIYFLLAYLYANENGKAAAYYQNISRKSLININNNKQKDLTATINQINAQIPLQARPAYIKLYTHNIDSVYTAQKFQVQFNINDKILSTMKLLKKNGTTSIAASLFEKNILSPKQKKLAKLVTVRGKN